MERYTPIKQVTQNQYLEIWTHYSIGHLTQKQLSQFFECSEDKVANAIEWVANNRLKFDSKVVAEAAKEALEARLRDLNGNIVKIKESKPINWNAVIGMYKLVETTEKLLWQLQAVNQDNSDNIHTGNMLVHCQLSFCINVMSLELFSSLVL